MKKSCNTSCDHSDYFPVLRRHSISAPEAVNGVIGIINLLLINCDGACAW